jgi:hypothetical protein
VAGDAAAVGLATSVGLVMMVAGLCGILGAVPMDAGTLGDEVGRKLPLGVMRCRFEEALRAEESGRYLARAVRMNVCDESVGCIDFLLTLGFLW